MMRYKLRIPISYLPEFVLRFLGRHWRLMEDPSDGWNFWIDASYFKYCRLNMTCMSCDGNDGYGPAPHHDPDCYFASWEDAE